MKKFSRSRLRIIYLFGLIMMFAPFALYHGSRSAMRMVASTPVDAKVLSNERLCRVWAKTPEAQSQLDADTPWAKGAWASCEQANEFVEKGTSRNHKLQLFDSFQLQVVTVEYTAPSDQSVRIAQMQSSGATISSVRGSGEHEPGSVIQIRADKHEPEKVSW